MAGHLGKKIKMAQGGDSGNWSSTSGKANSRKECPGCHKPYKGMSARQQRDHAKVMKYGRQTDCPDL